MPQCPKCGALLSKLRPHSKEWYCADCGFEGEEVHDPNMGCWYHLSGMRETATCPLEGRVVALEAKQKQEHAQHLTDTLHIERQDKEVAELEARLQALEQLRDKLNALAAFYEAERPAGRTACPRCGSYDHWDCQALGWHMQPVEPAAPAQAAIIDKARLHIRDILDRAQFADRELRELAEPRQGAGK